MTRDTQNHRGKKRHPILKVAVTGSAGSGKTFICNRLKILGMNIVSTDQIAREVVSPGSSVLQAIAAHFGGQILQSDGTLDRSRLRQRIIEDPSQKQALEKMIHPAILKRMRETVDHLEKQNVSVVLVEVPLLFELGLAGEFDLVVMVTAARERKIDRMVNRDRVTREDAAALLDRQLPDAEKINRSDIIIENNGSLEELRRSAQDLYRSIMQKS
jgi:dephospho-CoA kinase